MNNPYHYNPGAFWNNNYGFSPFNSGWGYNNFGWNNGGYAGFNGFGNNGFGFNRPVIFVVSDKNNTSGRNNFRPALGAYNNTFYEKGSGSRSGLSSGYKPGNNSSSGSLFRSIFAEGSSGSGGSSYDKSARSLNSGANSSGSTNSSNSSGSSGSSRSSGGSTGSSRGGRGG